jgi:hypothetical protein
MNKHCEYSFQFMIDHLQNVLKNLVCRLNALDIEIAHYSSRENEERMKNNLVLLQREKNITQRFNEQTMFHSWDMALYHGTSEGLKKQKQCISNTIQCIIIKRENLLKKRSRLQESINNNIKILRKYEAHKQIICDNHCNHIKRVESRKEEENMFLNETCKWKT